MNTKDSGCEGQPDATPDGPFAFAGQEVTVDRPTALERAFEIAREGQFNSLSKIAGQLAREGYTLDEQRQLFGATLARQLRELAAKAR